MDVIVNLLIWLHIIAFIAGGSNSVVGPVIGARLASARGGPMHAESTMAGGHLAPGSVD